MNEIIQFIIDNKSSVRYRDFIIDMFTETTIEAFDDDPSIINIEEMSYINKNKRNIYSGKIFSYLNNFYYFTYQVRDTFGSWGFKKLPFDQTKLPIKFKDKFILEKGMIENYNGDPIETTIGKYIINQLLIIEPFGSIFNYVNEKWNIRKFEKEIVNYTFETDNELEKTRRLNQIKHYLKNIFFVSSWTIFSVPSISKKSLTTSKEVIKKREELLEKYKDSLNDPIVMIEIENTLKTMDREYLKGDSSMGFFGNKAKVFDVQRKKMFLMGGMTETFGQDIKGFDFVKGNLDTGWRKEELPILFNEISKGSYDRGIETAKGGAETKFFGRQFQESKIVEEDCGSTDGLLITLNENNVDKFLNRYIILKDKLEFLTTENKDKYLHKEIKIRSAQHCKSKTGYCYTCLDNNFKKIGLKKLNVVPITITSAFLTQAMKSMHGKSISSFEIKSLNQFTT